MVARSGHNPSAHYYDRTLSSLRNYLMKYLRKTFMDGMKDWPAEELVFNAIAWKEGYRFNPLLPFLYFHRIISFRIG